MGNSLSKISTLMTKNKKALPQRKTHKNMSGKEMLNKVIFGTPKPKTTEQKRKEEWENAAKGKK